MQHEALKMPECQHRHAPQLFLHAALSFFYWTEHFEQYVLYRYFRVLELARTPGSLY
jgi:hypothetical protein